MLYLVTGPPAAGKSSWIQERAKASDVVIDFDLLAKAVTPKGSERPYPAHVIEVVKAARIAAMDEAVKYRSQIDVYVIHVDPSPALLRVFKNLRAQVVVIDPGADVVLERCRRERPTEMLKIAERYYEKQAPVVTVPTTDWWAG